MEETNRSHEDHRNASHSESKKTPQTMLDQLVCDDRSQIMKAALPYLPEQGRGIFAIYAKYLELQHTFRLFSPPGAVFNRAAFTDKDQPQLLSSVSKEKEVPENASEDEELLHAASTAPNDPLEMLQDIRNYVKGPARDQVDSLVNMLAMVQMIQIMNESEVS